MGKTITGIAFGIVFPVIVLWIGYSYQESIADALASQIIPLEDTTQVTLGPLDDLGNGVLSGTVSYRVCSTGVCEGAAYSQTLLLYTTTLQLVTTIRVAADGTFEYKLPAGVYLIKAASINHNEPPFLKPKKISIKKDTINHVSLVFLDK